jgi:hypothetical protein
LRTGKLMCWSKGFAIAVAGENAVRVGFSAKGKPPVPKFGSGKEIVKAL